MVTALGFGAGQVTKKMSTASWAAKPYTACIMEQQPSNDILATRSTWSFVELYVGLMAHWSGHRLFRLFWTSLEQATSCPILTLWRPVRHVLLWFSRCINRHTAGRTQQHLCTMRCFQTRKLPKIFSCSQKKHPTLSQMALVLISKALYQRNWISVLFRTALFFIVFYNYSCGWNTAASAALSAARRPCALIFGCAKWSCCGAFALVLPRKCNFRCTF